MLISGDWVTPMTTEKGLPTPFLGKPPLQFWLTALSLSIFGYTELAARLPSLIATLGTLLIVYRFSALFFTPAIGLCAAALQLSSLIGYFFAGACMLDPLLTLAVALSTLGLPLSLRCRELGLRRESTAWEFASFLGLGVGLLTKGPVALVLTVGSLVPWIIAMRPWRELRSIRWIYGLTLTACIATPWYIIADIRQPGFLHYFIIHENFLRFLVKEYGDLYGSGHRHFRGMIWCMALLACAPWSFIALPLLAKNFSSLLQLKARFKEIRLESSPSTPAFLVLWGLALFPLIFFTASRQVSIYYVLPSVPALAILFTMYGERLWGTHRALLEGCCRALSILALIGIPCIAMYAGSKRFDAYIGLAITMPLVMLSGYLYLANRNPTHSCISVFSRTAVYFVTLYLTAALLQLTDYVGGASSRDLIAAIAERKGVTKVLFHQKLPHSAVFYSDAIVGPRSMTLTLVDEVPPELLPDEVFVIRSKKLGKMKHLLPTGVQERTIPEGGWTIISTP